MLAMMLMIWAGAAAADGTHYEKPSDTELRAKLTADQYKCTQESGTEKAFENKYWNNHEDGIYVDVVSGEPLFSSLDKYDSGSGWPSFTRSLEKEAVREKEDKSLFRTRTEVRSRGADSHLGHVFDDGPGPDHKRFCINSAALRFVPVDQLEAEKLGRYLFLFSEKKNWEVATLAGGCFWGMEEILRQIPGVLETQTGYSGGAESVQILFDPKKISYEKILLTFFKMHDPTTPNRQNNDVGPQYRSAIFFRSESQKQTAETVKARVEHSKKWPKPLVTEIVPEAGFERAPESHQKYLVQHPNGYTCHFVRKMDF